MRLSMSVCCKASCKNIRAICSIRPLHFALIWPESWVQEVSTLYREHGSLPSCFRLASYLSKRALVQVPATVRTSLERPFQMLMSADDHCDIAVDIATAASLRWCKVILITYWSISFLHPRERTNVLTSRISTWTCSFPNNLSCNPYSYIQPGKYESLHDDELHFTSRWF